jgi:LEA14-like dessication related protein
MSPRPLIFVPILCGLFLATTSCTYLKEAIGLGPIRPKITLHQVEVKYATIQALTLVVSIKIENPNDFDLNLKNLQYDVHALELKLATGNYKERISVPAEGSYMVKLPVAVNPVNAIAVIKKIMAQGPDVKATVKASADFESPVGDMEVAFEQTKALSDLAKM